MLTKINNSFLPKVSFFFFIFITHLLQASPLLNFTSTSRTALTDPIFIQTLVKAAGVPVVSVNKELNGADELTEVYLFQKHNLAPLFLSINQQRLIISWEKPKASSQEIYKVNSENQRIMANLLNYLFGNSDLLALMLSRDRESFQSNSTNGIWRIEINKQQTKITLMISPSL